MSKPDLVLLHGWGMNHAVWQNLRPELSDKVNLITPDLPGFGAEQRYPHPYQLDSVLQQLLPQIPDNSLVCGWSLGGLLAIALAAAYPHKVRQLGLLAASPCFLEMPDWPGMSAVIMQQFSQSLLANQTVTVESFLAIQAIGSVNAKTDIKQLKQAILTLPQAQPAVLQGGLELLAATDLRQQFSALTMPVTGCFGRLDSLVPVAVVPLLQQLQPAATFTVLEKASHAPFISHPAAFISWLEQWLENTVIQ